MITRQAAIELCVELWPLFKEHGYYVGLTGSCLYKGYSDKDIDLILYPHRGPGHPINSAAATINTVGFSIDYEKKGSPDEQVSEFESPDTTSVRMLCYVTTFRNLRIDIFVLS